MKNPTDEGRLGVLSLLDRPTGNVGIELGVAAGDFSARLLESGRFDRLYGVDAYADHHEVNEYRLALRRLGPSGGYTLLRMFFDEALELFAENGFELCIVDMEGAYPSWAVRKTTETITGGPTPELRRAARNARIVAGLCRAVVAPFKRFIGGRENCKCGKHPAGGLY